MGRVRRRVMVAGGVAGAATLASVIAVVVVGSGGADQTSAPSADERALAGSDRGDRVDASPALESTSIPDVNQRRGAIGKAIDSGTSARLRKAELRPSMKAIFPLLQQCYEHALSLDPDLSGVINTRMTIRNEPRMGMSLTVNGFETAGPLGESREFLACAKETLESQVFPPIEPRGRLDVTYPTTFARRSPDNRDKGVFDKAARAALEGHWSEALASAERGLELTSFDGPHRRRLIEVAGLAACHLEDEAKARHYFSLASPEFEDHLQQACLQFATLDLLD